MLRSWRRNARGWGLIAAIAATGACGGDNSGPTDGQVVLAKATKSGDQQVGIVGEPLPNDLRVVVTRDGVPASKGIPVAWSTGTAPCPTARA